MVFWALSLPPSPFLPPRSLSRSLSQVSKLKRDLAYMKQELQYKEQGFNTLRE